MRFMVIRKADKNTEAGALPGQELLTAMLKYNEELREKEERMRGEAGKRR